MKDEVINATPPVGVSALTVMGVPLSEWVYIVTIVYVLIQITVLLYRTFWRCEK